MMNKREVLLRTILYETANDLLIVKARPKKILLLEQRLNGKLNDIVEKVVNKTIKRPLYDPSEYTPEFQNLYKAHLTSVFGVGANEILKAPQISLTKSPVPDLKLNNIISNRSFNAAKSTTDRLIGDVLPKIKEGVSSGNTLEKTAESLKTEFNDMAKYELQRISRTETQSVYNQSKYETMFASDIIKFKKWVSSGLSNMRESHADMDGEIVGVDEPFSNGLMYPGDPNGEPEEVINCACTMVPVLDPDKE